MLTDEQIESIARPFMQHTDGFYECDMVIPSDDIIDFAHAIEQTIKENTNAEY